ncbi:tetratricopeptide repeat protein [Calidithermus roseus]|uniref:Tetratricopeptide repeat protein n=1 Tax=Calidithermus roseus TaxID=1644118 RepID=A0A399EXV8_9DEIN|nr:tetratricopeptide repeat protein [Calidithermus roseus]RIH88435.1 Tetratricopeptide repeat protein [Calidithermus roseus]
MAAHLSQTLVTPAGFSGWLGRLRPVAAKRVGLALGLWGEAGVGKSWTARRLLGETACKGFSLHATAPLAELAGLASALSKPGRLPLWAQRVLERLTRGEFAEASQVADALGALLAALAPVIVHLEDLHEAEAQRLELVGMLAQRAGRTRGVALLVTSRMQPPQPFEAVRLEPLEPEASRALLENEVGASLPEEATRWIYARARGNPLFTLEYLRYLARQGFLWNDRTRWHWRTPTQDLIPLTVEALLERQILEVPGSAAVRKAFEARAILPPEASEELWARVAGLGPADLEEARARLLEQGILRGSDFAHPLFREVRRGTLRPERKQALARRALEALAGDPEAAAGFVEEAGLEPEQAKEWLLQAAQSAKRRGNEVQAARFVARAVEYAQGEERGRLALEAARILRSADLPRAVKLLELVLRSRSDDVEATYLLAELLAHKGQQAEVERVLQTLPESLRQGSAWLLRLIHLKAILDDHAGVVELWERHPQLHPQAKADTVALVSDAMLALGQFEQSQTWIDAVLMRPNLTNFERAKLQVNLARAKFFLGQFEPSLALVEAALSSLRQYEAPRDIALALHRKGIILHYSARFAEALGAFQEAYEVFSNLGDGRWCAILKNHMAASLLQLNQDQVAEDYHLEALEYLRRLDASDFLGSVLNSLAWLYSSRGTPLSTQLGLKYAREACALAETLKSPRAKINAKIQMIYALIYAGRPAEGLAAAEESIAQLRQGNYPQLLGMYLDARAEALERLGQPERALQDLREAYSIADRIGDLLMLEWVGVKIDWLTGNLSGVSMRLERARSRGWASLEQWILREFPQLAQPAPAPQAPLTGVSPLAVLGSMLLGGKPIRGQKRKELLALLVEARIAGRLEVGTLELLEALYPGLPETEAANLLKQAVFQARTHLGQGVIATTPGGYALGSLETDAELFLKTGDTRLWRGGFLEDASGDRDEAVRGALYQALAGRVRSLLEPEPHEAVRLGQILLSAEPYDSEILALTLRALRQEGNRLGLSRLYQEARERMKEVGEALPEDWQGFLEHHPA